MILSISSGGKFEVAMSEVMNWLNQIGAWQWIFNYSTRRRPIHLCIGVRYRDGWRRPTSILQITFFSFFTTNFRYMLFSFLTKTRGPQQDASENVLSFFFLWVHSFFLWISKIEIWDNNISILLLWWKLISFLKKKEKNYLLRQ